MIAKDIKRKNRVRFKIKKVNKGKPRLTVFRSAKNIYAQVIDDNKRVTLASASSVEKNMEKKPKKELSEIVGKYKYHGRVKQLAESAKSGGLKF